MTAIWVAIIVGTVSPATLAVLTHLLARATRREDYARQDAIAAKVEAATKKQAEVAVKVDEVAEIVAVRAAEAASLQVKSNERVAETAAATKETVDQVHVMLNNEKTAAIREKVDEAVVKLVLLREIADLRRDAGRSPSEATQAAIEATETSIAKMKEAIATREEQERVAARLAP